MKIREKIMIIGISVSIAVFIMVGYYVPKKYLTMKESKTIAVDTKIKDTVKQDVTILKNPDYHPIIAFKYEDTQSTKHAGELLGCIDKKSIYSIKDIKFNLSDGTKFTNDVVGENYSYTAILPDDKVKTVTAKESYYYEDVRKGTKETAEFFFDSNLENYTMLIGNCTWDPVVRKAKLITPTGNKDKFDKIEKMFQEEEAKNATGGTTLTTEEKAAAKEKEGTQKKVPTYSFKSVKEFDMMGDGKKQYLLLNKSNELFLVTGLEKGDKIHQISWKMDEKAPYCVRDMDGDGVLEIVFVDYRRSDYIKICVSKYDSSNRYGDQYKIQEILSSTSQMP